MRWLVALGTVSGFLVGVITGMAISNAITAYVLRDVVRMAAETVWK